MAIFRKSNLTMSDHETWSNWDFFIFMKVGGCKQDLLIQELFHYKVQSPHQIK